MSRCYATLQALHDRSKPINIISLGILVTVGWFDSRVKTSEDNID